MTKQESRRRKAVLVGIAGSNNAFSLSLYNLKAYALADAGIRSHWQLDVIQHPLINVTRAAEQVAPLAERIVARRPELIAFSCYLWNIEVFRALATMLRERLPDAKIVWGGPEIATDYLKEGRYNDLPADYCVSGEGELTFLELLRHLNDGKPALADIHGLSWRTAPHESFIVNVRRTPFKTLLDVPSPFLSGVVDDEVLFRPKVQANIETQRGCNLRCSYCVYHKDMEKISYASVERTIDEVRYCINKGVRNIRFVDANFGSDLAHAKAVMRGLVHNRFEATLMMELIPGFIDEELAALFGEYNSLYERNEITLGVGVQTINVEVLRKIRRAIRLERFEQTFDLLQRYNVYAKIDLIIGLPGETLESIENTLEYMLGRLHGSSAHLLCCHVMRGLPGTELLDIAKEYGMVFSSQYDPHELDHSPALPRDDMLKCLRRTAVIFRMVNHEGWANREFLTGNSTTDTCIHDAFFAARERLGCSHIAVIDHLVEALMESLRLRNSRFAQPDFPHAETWWWSLSALEIKDDWLVAQLNAMTV